MRNDSVEVEHWGNFITEMLLLCPDHAHMTQIDRYCLLGCWFYFQKFKKAVTCVACGDILRENSALEINIEGLIPENCQFFVGEINRSLVKPSDFVYARCALAWNTYLQIMKNSETKSLSLSSNTH